MEAQNFQPSTPDLTPDPIVPAPGRAIPGFNPFSSHQGYPDELKHPLSRILKRFPLTWAR